MTGKPLGSEQENQ